MYISFNFNNYFHEWVGVEAAKAGSLINQEMGKILKKVIINKPFKGGIING